MSELKTLRNNGSVEAFIASVVNIQRREDALALLDVFEEATNVKPVMWGDSIIGYGQYHYKSDRSSQEGDWPLVAYSPRKANLTVYIIPGFDDYQDLLAKLGKHKTSVSCIYVNRLSDINIEVLREIIAKAFREMKKQYAA